VRANWQQGLGKARVYRDVLQIHGGRDFDGDAIGEH